jgi:transposase
MAAPRKHPPAGALEEIERMALKGHSTTGIAKFFNVSRACVKRWFEENERFEEAYEQGRDAYRQALEEQLVAATLAGRNVAGLIYLLKSKFKMYDVPNTAANKVDVNVNTVHPVMVVKDMGSDEEWSARAAKQQAELLAGHVPPRQPSSVNRLDALPDLG